MLNNHIFVYCTRYCQRYATFWSICVEHGSVLTLIGWGGKWEHNCTLHKHILCAICVPKIIKVGGNLTTFWQKLFFSFLRHRVDGSTSLCITPTVWTASWFNIAKKKQESRRMFVLYERF